jgi:hypothetical protein
VERSLGTDDEVPSIEARIRVREVGPDVAAPRFASSEGRRGDELDERMVDRQERPQPLGVPDDPRPRPDRGSERRVGERWDWLVRGRGRNGP